MNVRELKREPDAEVVSLLEKMLVRAKNGEIAAVAVAAAFANGEGVVNYGGSRYVSLLAMVHILAYRITVAANE